MAQNIWINVTADKTIVNNPNAGRHGGSTVAGGASASGDFTISYDNAVITTLNTFDSLVRSVRARLAASGLK